MSVCSVCEVNTFKSCSESDCIICKLRKQLEIARETLSMYANEKNYILVNEDDVVTGDWHILLKIKRGEVEVYAHHPAREALDKMEKVL